MYQFLSISFLTAFLGIYELDFSTFPHMAKNLSFVKNNAVQYLAKIHLWARKDQK